MIKVILADNNYIDLEYIKTVIDWEEYGFQIVEQALNGDELMEKYKIYYPDLVITEYTMKEIQGIELAKKIKGFENNTEIIFMSNDKSFNFVQNAINVGAFDYMIKKELSEAYLVERLEKLKMKVQKYGCLL